MHDVDGKRRRLFGAALVVLTLVGTLVALEVAARLFWKVRYDVRLSRPDRMLAAVYPELWDVEWKGAELRKEHPVRVLLLGGSALHPAWGNVEQELREGLTARLRRPVVILNLAQIGHTSRDSAVKYAALAGQRFDLVVVYHGINEARANNVPPARFRADYSHYAWYDAVDALETCRAWFLLPCTVRFLAVLVQDRLGLVEYVSMDAPRPEWVAYGEDVKSAAPFEANLRAVVTMAHARHEPVLLMTFATYVADGYSLEAFRARALDYTLHLSPLEMWGAPANVMKAVARHNDVVRSVAGSDPQIRLVDQANLMPKGGRWFNDVCHLTGAGSAAFVAGMLDAAVAALGEPSAQALPPVFVR